MCGRVRRVLTCLITPPAHGTHSSRTRSTGIETWGRGALKIAELTTESGLAAPEFESDRFGVTVRFRPTSYVPPLRMNHEQRTGSRVKVTMSDPIRAKIMVSAIGLNSTPDGPVRT